MSRIIEQIEKRMKAVEMTQAEMAKKVNVSPVTICRYMKGERFPDLEILEQMADAIGLKLVLMEKSTKEKEVLESISFAWRTASNLEQELWQIKEILKDE